MRLFVAVNFTDQVKHSLLDGICSLRTQASRGNFTREENLHLTLAFLGETKEVVTAKYALTQYRCQPFILTVAGCVRFGDLWWAGGGQGSRKTANPPHIHDGGRNLPDALRQNQLQTDIYRGFFKKASIIFAFPFKTTD